MNPTVSVLMPVYNGEKYLNQSINSILSQTFMDFEFIIIDDGSTDKSKEIILGYSDPRIRLISNENNMGISASLNIGLDQSLGKYIARMDFDDISLPSRLEKQVDFMHKNSEVGICGSWIETIGNRKNEVWKYPIDSNIVQSRLIFDSPIAHPSVIFRNEFFNKFNLRYNENCMLAQDWELWQRCCRFFKITNIPEVLLYYRIHEKSFGVENKIKRRNIIQKIDEKNLMELGIVPDEEELILHRNIASSLSLNKMEYIYNVNNWLIKLHESNSAKRIYPEPAFSAVLCELLFGVCNRFSLKGFDVWTFFNESPLSEFISINLYRKLKFKYKSFMKKHNYLWDKEEGIL